MIIALDTETTGRDFFHGCKPFLVTAYDGETVYWWSGTVNPHSRAEVVWEQEDLDDLQNFIDNAEQIIFHNAKFDIRALETIGINCCLWDKIDDTLIASHVCCSGESHKLKTLAFKYLGYVPDKEQTLHNAVVQARQEAPATYDIARKGHPCFPAEKKGWAYMDYWLCPEECLRYGSDDVIMTRDLWFFYRRTIDKLNAWENYEDRRALLRITYEMETVGFHYNLDDARTRIRLFAAQEESHRQRVQQEAKISTHLDLRKERDMNFLLFERLDLPVLERSDKTDKPLINKDVLKKYADTYPDIAPLQHFMDYRKAGARISDLESYNKSVAPDGGIHASFLITGTRETRQSTSPNIQNVEKSIADVFGPPREYVWLVYDLVNIELRIWGYEVGNPKMVEIFNQRKSFHIEICRILYPRAVQYCEENDISFKKFFGDSYYSWVKNGNFCLIYGGGEAKANRTYKAHPDGHLLHLLSPEKFPAVPVENIDAYSKIIGEFPEAGKFGQQKIKEVLNNDKRYNYPFITCLGGYRLDVNPDQIYTTACNYFCQGSAGYIIGLCMQEVDADPLYRSTGSQIVNQIHDSLYIQVPEENLTEELQDSIKLSMERGGERLLPSCEAELEKIIYPK